MFVFDSVSHVNVRILLSCKVQGELSQKLEDVISFFRNAISVLLPVEIFLRLLNLDKLFWPKHFFNIIYGEFSI